MALSSLQKLFKNSPPPSRILASLSNQSLKPTPTTCPVNEINLIPHSNPSKAKIFSPFDTLPFSSIHPSLGLFSLHPILSIGDVQQQGEEEDSGMWADSVKKKRKKKMNKHKYKKLRKKLRRKT